MRKLLIPFAALVAGLAFAAPAAQASSGALPPNSSAFGDSRTGWAREYTQWLLGDESDPIGNGECGAAVRGVFFLVTVLDSQTIQCDVPVGMPILVEHAAYFAWIPADGSNDAEIVATAHNLFGDPESSLTIDGKSAPLTTTETGAFDVISEPGSAYDELIGLGTGPIRTAVAGEFTLIRPLTPGSHEIVGNVDFSSVGGPEISVTYELEVG